MSGWTPRLSALNDALAELYPTSADARRLVRNAGLKLALIEFSETAIINWFNILEHARQRGAVDAIVEAALRDHPQHPVLRGS